MLRFLVLLLLLANGVYYAWAQGHLAALGWARASQSEPQRLQSQIKPEALRVLTPAEAQRVEAMAAAPAPKAPECLQSGLLDERLVASARAALSAVPASSFSFQPAVEPARWIVYMGKYANAEALAKKKSELREIGVNYESLRNSSLEIGLSLGAHASQAQANESLAQLTRRGVRTARVTLESPEQRGQRLVLPVVDDALRPQLDGLRNVLGNGGLTVCKT
jgi:hypothetical protein